MALVKRTRGIVAPIVPNGSITLQVQEEKKAVSLVKPPLRRMDITINKAVEAKQQIQEQLKLISDSEEAIDRATLNINAATDKIDALMREFNFTLQTNGVKTAEIKEAFTRQSRTVSPQKFRNKVTAKDFWNCIEIKISAAEKLLGEKELNGISDVIPSKSLGFVLKVRDAQKKDK